MANIIKQFKDTNGNNVYPIAYAQGGVKMDLLWTNPNPTSQFAGQTIPLDTAEYDAYLIYYYENNAYPYTRSFIMLNDMECTIPAGYSNWTNKRKWTMNGSGLTIENADTQYVYPILIYGIKMSYVVPTTVHGLQYVEV